MNISAFNLFAATVFFVSGPHGIAAAAPPVAEIVRFKSQKLADTNSVAMAALDNGGWRCRIAKETIDAYRLQHILITSPLARARKGEPGYFILGDGRYGTFRLDNGICGEKRGKQGFLPVSGMSTPRGTYMVVARGLALESDFSVVVSNGIYSLVTAFRLRGLVARPGDHPYEDVVLDFLPMPPGQTSYADIARRYRKERLDRGEVSPLSERACGNKVLSYTARSIFVRVKHGWKALNTDKDRKARFEHQSPSNEPPIEVSIDFAHFKDIMRRMKEAGIDEAEVCSVGGTAGGFDGRFPDILPIPDEFGGEQGLRDAIAYGRSLGYQMNVHFATTAMLECARRWNPDDLCLKPDGSPLVAGNVAGGRTHRLCPKVYEEKFLNQDWRTFRDLGFFGTHHIDVISCIRPYQCFNPLHPLNAAESAELFRRVGRRSREVFGAFGSEAGMDWMAPDLDFALYTSWFPGWGRRMESELIDRLVPFWQLVYHGIIVSNPFYATIDAYIERKGRLYADGKETYHTFGDAETRILKLHEFGGRPVFYYTLYDDISPLKRAYDDYKRRSHLQYFFMDDHRELAKDVFLIRYSDGEEMVVNYRTDPYRYRGTDVAGRSMRVIP